MASAVLQMLPSSPCLPILSCLTREPDPKIRELLSLVLLGVVDRFCEAARVPRSHWQCVIHQFFWKWITVDKRAKTTQWTLATSLERLGSRWSDSGAECCYVENVAPFWRKRSCLMPSNTSVPSCYDKEKWWAGKKKKRPTRLGVPFTEGNDVMILFNSGNHPSTLPYWNDFTELLCKTRKRSVREALNGL